MNQPTTPTANPTPDAPAKPARKGLNLKFVLLIALIAAVAAWPFCPWLKPVTSRLFSASGSVTVPVSSNVMDQRLATLENHINDLDSKLERITAALDKTSAAIANSGEGNGVPPAALNGVQQDISTLASTVTALQSEVKSTKEAAQVQQEIQKNLATTLTPPQLADAFNALETPIYKAVQKASAQTWVDRALVELQSIVTVRHINDNGLNSKLTDIERKLHTGDIAEALATVKELPPEAAKILDSWQHKAEMRLAAEQALRALNKPNMETAEPVTQVTP